jgi:hypothetical protein
LSGHKGKAEKAGLSECADPRLAPIESQPQRPKRLLDLGTNQLRLSRAFRQDNAIVSIANKPVSPSREVRVQTIKNGVGQEW